MCANTEGDQQNAALFFLGPLVKEEDEEVTQRRFRKAVKRGGA